VQILKIFKVNLATSVATHCLEYGRFWQREEKAGASSAQSKRWREFATAHAVAKRLECAPACRRFRVAHDPCQRLDRCGVV
jgi:hypothetical protein